MASDLSFVKYVRDQINADGQISFRKMFGEYAIYDGEKVVALVCDNQLFVKPTVAGRSMITNPVEAPPYPKAKPYFLIDEQLDDPSEQDLNLLIETFADHELGQVPPKYAAAIQRLSQRFRLALVIDIWAPKSRWVKALSDCGVLQLCEAVSFSSDHGMVKPSPQPFWQVLAVMQVDRQDAIVMGDSVRRDLGGAIAAGINCILVGGAQHPSAFGVVNSLLDLVDAP
jgi:FMN phosphatase YigB (HAD superfamily)